MAGCAIQLLSQHQSFQRWIQLAGGDASNNLGFNGRKIGVVLIGASTKLVLLLTKPTAGKSRKGTRRVAPWTAGTCPRFSMRSLLSRVSGALPSTSKPTSGPSSRGGTAQQASPRESGDKSHAVVRRPLAFLSPHGLGFAVNAWREPRQESLFPTTPARCHSNLSGIRQDARVSSDSAAHYT